MSSKGKRFALSVFLVGSILSGLLIYAMPCGPWAFSDSAAYLSTAQNLAEGKGFGYFSPFNNFKPLVLHPPLYPLILSSAILAGVAPLKAAAWLNILAFVLWFTISACLLYRITRSIFYALVPCLIVVSYADFLGLFTGAMTESIFILFSFSGLLLLMDRLQSLHARAVHAQALALPAILLALSSLTRYIGIAFILTGAALVLLYFKASWQQRFFKAALFALLTCLPLLVWLVVSSLPGNGFGGRAFSPVTNESVSLHEYYNGFKAVVVTWIPYINRLTRFISVDVRLGMLAFMTAAFTGMQLFLIRRKTFGNEYPQIARLSLAFWLSTFLYIVIHLIQYVYSYPQPDVSGRILAPLIVNGIFYIFTCLRSAGLWCRPNMKWIPALISLILILVIPYYQRPRTFEYLSDLHHEGYGFTEVIYCQSQIIAKLKTLPGETPLVSNEPFFSLLHANRMAIQYPITSATEPYFLLLLSRPLTVQFGSEQTANILAMHQNQCQTEYSDSAGAIFFCQ